MINNVNIEDIKNIAVEAGKAVMEIYWEDFDIHYKNDNSPLTTADLQANEIICNSLQQLYPEIPIISEENSQIDFEIRKDWDYYFCIDPIDGTVEFIKKNGEFTINIALIERTTPVLGVVYAPALKDLYWAEKGRGAFKNGDKLPLKINEKKEETLCVVVSKSHLSKETQEYVDNLEAKEVKQVAVGSSLKLCMVASGEADIYPKLGPTMEWDTAAADTIVRESGKMSFDFKEKEPLVYNKNKLLNPWFIVK